MIVLAQEEYNHQIQNQILKDPKSFWKYAKAKKNSRTPQGISKDGEVLDDHQCAKEFAHYFHSVYREERATYNISEVIKANNDNLGARIHINCLRLQEVQCALSHLKPKKSVGPDGIPAYILRDCSSVLAQPLLHIFNLCLKLSVFPARWKVSRVVPVPKEGLKCKIEGYRPIAVLSSPAKVLESTIHKCIFTEVRSQLTEFQHGFQPIKSTTSNLLSYMAHIVPIVDSGGQVDAAYFDYKKAFDLVDHDILLKKLAAVGFTPHLLQFFISYLSDRMQYVEYAGQTSDTYYTWSGVSQGSNLGPLLFILMINDLPQSIKNANCLLFADDLKLFFGIKNLQDCQLLQNDITNIVAWTKDNRLQFNIQKSQTITFSRAISPIMYNYKINAVEMTKATEVRDLGVEFNTGLTFRNHIIKCCRKAYRNLGFMLRTVRGFTNIIAITTLYNALVRSQLECNAIIWDPHEAKYSLMLERVQNKFLRFLYLRQYGVYPYYPLMYPTLFILGMVGYNELKVRRYLALASYLFKLIRGKIYNADILQRVGLYVPDRYVWRRRRPRLLAVPRARTNLLLEAPLSRALRTINSVSEEIDIFCCSLNEFTKTALHIICYTNN